MRDDTPRKGFVLVAFTLALLLILGAVGLSFDIGRMYITRNESQSFCDAASIAAALKLDGTSDGIANARAAALATVKGYQFGTEAFTTDKVNIQVTFSTSLANPFVAAPADPSAYSYARVTVTNVQLPMALMPVLTNTFSASIAATATAAQLRLSGAPNNVFPFSPYKHPSNYTPDAPTAEGCGTTAVSPGCFSDAGFVIPKGGTYATRTADVGADAALLNGNPISPYSGAYGAALGEANPFGMILAVYNDADGNTHYRHGGLYTLQWASKPPNDPPDASDLSQGLICPGDYSGLSAAIGDAVSGLHGYIWQGDSTAVITGKILNSNTAGTTVTVGEQLAPTTGNKEAITKAINDRVAMDMDTTSQWYIDYLRNRRQLGIPDGLNEYRVVTVPINTGECGSIDGGAYSNPCTSSFEVVEFAKFFLLPSYQMGGNRAVCAEYIGTATVEGGGNGAPGPGFYAVRLVQ